MSTSDTASAPRTTWPAKVDVLGIGVSVTNYDEALLLIAGAAKRNESAIVSCHAVHAIVSFCRTLEMRNVANRFEMITPDGQPVRWAMNCLHKTDLRERVYGPELMLRLCQAAADSGVRVALLGGTPETLRLLTLKLTERFPQLPIVAAISPPYRPLEELDVEALASELTTREAQLVFIGLGCPKQDLFADALRSKITAVQVCVGAAFDLHAGRRAMAPAWMQRRGLEWLYRLLQEPTRLAGRYAITNIEFVARLLYRGVMPQPPSSTATPPSPSRRHSQSKASS